MPPLAPFAAVPRLAAPGALLVDEVPAGHGAAGVGAAELNPGGGGLLLPPHVHVAVRWVRMGAGGGRNGDFHVRLIDPGYPYRIGDGCVGRKKKLGILESAKKEQSLMAEYIFSGEIHKLVPPTAPKAHTTLM